jgi:hypothetical protein
VKPARPVGFAALLEKMPPDFVAQAKAVEEQARRRREAQAQRFELAFFGGSAGRSDMRQRRPDAEAEPGET